MFNRGASSTMAYIVDGLCGFMFAPLGLGPWTWGPHNIAADGWAWRGWRAIRKLNDCAKRMRMVRFENGSNICEPTCSARSFVLHIYQNIHLTSETNSLWYGMIELMFLCWYQTQPTKL
jgi:hypothetical protein